MEKQGQFEFNASKTGEGSVSIAFRHAVAKEGAPTFVWLGGFRSDMLGTKAEAMVEQAAEFRANSFRFDYSGHGESGGDFAKGTISKWLAQSLAVIRAETEGPLILLGSSMGGWISLRMVQEMQTTGDAERIAALLLIAPAPDFATELMEPSFSNEQREAMARDGYILEPSEYSDEPTMITRDLIEDGRQNRIFSGPYKAGVPVRILQGMQDPDVPYEHVLRLVSHLGEDDVVVTMVRDGDHRLSRDQDIDLLKRAMHDVYQRVTNDR